MSQTTAQATFGGGCFWCVEAAFERVRGVESTISGYAGGHADDPTYQEVCSGTTGHAEVVQVTYDTDEISYADLLEVFFTMHNPETKDREGPDTGSQYRSIVLYHDETQKETVESYVEELEAAGEYDTIVTEVEPLETFWRAEDKHQDYYEKNPDQPYCAMQIPPKLEKLESKHRDKLKPE
ncbi:peptide-methionine (S)-S-oxide reductase MsrA [Halobacteriales archaeon Cl-PHB]